MVGVGPVHIALNLVGGSGGILDPIATSILYRKSRCQINLILTSSSAMDKGGVESSISKLCVHSSAVVRMHWQLLLSHTSSFLRILCVWL